MGSNDLLYFTNIVIILLFACAFATLMRGDDQMPLLKIVVIVGI
jgi:hypothetical protein